MRGGGQGRGRGVGVREAMSILDIELVSLCRRPECVEGRVGVGGGRGRGRGI